MTVRIFFGLIFFLGVVGFGFSSATAEENSLRASPVKREIIPFTVTPSEDGKGCEAREDDTGKVLLPGIPCPVKPMKKQSSPDQWWDPPPHDPTLWDQKPKGTMVVAPSVGALRECLDGVSVSCFEVDTKYIRLFDNDKEGRELAERLGVAFIGSAVFTAGRKMWSLYRGCVRAVEETADGSGTMRVKDRTVYAVLVQVWNFAKPAIAGFAGPPVVPRRFPTVQQVDGTRFPLGCDGKPVPSGPVRKS